MPLECHSKSVLSVLLLFIFMMPAAAQTDSLYYGLDSTQIVRYKDSPSLKVKAPGTLAITMDLMGKMPKLLGNTDPLSILKYMSGVQTVSDYDSGMNIQGCDDSHNCIAMEGVPIYGAKHLFGLFSVFNPSHFGHLDFQKSPTAGSAPNRIGGKVDLRHKDLSDEKVTGELATGIMSSQGTLRIMAGKKTQFSLSARQSYMDLLYGRWMKFGDIPISYGFGDYNFSVLSELGPKDELLANAYYGSDRMRVIESGTNMFDIGLKWGNWAGSLHWNHKFQNSILQQTLYTTHYHSLGNFGFQSRTMELPSNIRSHAYEALWEDRHFKVGAAVILYRVQPQFPHFIGDDSIISAEKEIQKGLEANLSLDYTQEWSSGFGLEGGLKGSLYVSPEQKVQVYASPDLTLWYNSYSWGKLSLSYAMRRQFLFRAAMSNIAIPIDFWFMAGKHSAPQLSHDLQLAYTADFLNGMLSLDVSAYWKGLFHQVEYKSNILELFKSKYELEDLLLKGKGQNFGFNIMLSKNVGDLTGWISWSYGRALRTFENEGYEKTYPANHERIHELNAALAYQYRKWNFSSTMTCASGLPFTPPSYFYITSGQIVTLYGEHNSARMKPYFRLDVSVDYSFIRKKGQDFGMNVSVYNVLGNKNDALYLLNVKDDQFALEAMHYMLRFVPSISLFYKF